MTEAKFEGTLLQVLDSLMAAAENGRIVAIEGNATRRDDSEYAFATRPFQADPSEDAPLPANMRLRPPDERDDDGA